MSALGKEWGHSLTEKYLKVVKRFKVEGFLRFTQTMKSRKGGLKNRAIARHCRCVNRSAHVCMHSPAHTSTLEQDRRSWTPTVLAMTTVTIIIDGSWTTQWPAFIGGHAGTLLFHAKSGQWTRQLGNSPFFSCRSARGSQLITETPGRTALDSFEGDKM